MKKLRFISTQASITDLQGLREHFRPPERASISSKYDNSSLFSYFVGNSFYLDPDPDAEYGSGLTDPIESGSESGSLL
jgi:hypothetical protein